MNDLDHRHGLTGHTPLCILTGPEGTIVPFAAAREGAGPGVGSAAASDRPRNAPAPRAERARDVVRFAREACRRS